MIKKILLAATLAAAFGGANAATYVIDPTHTQVVWEQKHFGTSTNRGRFDKKSGMVEFDRAAKKGKVEITIETGSISTGVAPFDKHLQSDDFFASAKFPTATFKGDQFQFEGDKVVAVTGTLTLRGKSGPVTLKALSFNCYDNPMLKREVCGGDFETVIQRSKFDVSYGLQYGIADDTRLVIQVEAVKQ